MRHRDPKSRFTPTAVKKKTSQARSSAKPERAFVYRGIKIPPIRGKRSATAEAFARL